MTLPANSDRPIRVCFTANLAWNLAHFRLNHIRAVLDLGVEVHAAAPADRHVKTLEREGVVFHPWTIERRSLNPARELLSVQRLAKIYRAVQPDLVHHYTSKAVLYGTTSARWCRVPAVVNSITGLPYIVVSPKSSLRGKLARWVAMRWYSWSTVGSGTHAVVQNPDDLQVLQGFSKRPLTNFSMTAGSGVDLKRFAYKPLPAQQEPTILFVGRMLKEKGIYELVEAIRHLRLSERRFRFVICGNVDSGNRSSVSREQCDDWVRSGVIDGISRVDDVRPFLESASIVVLPSYREGTPRSLLEAMSIGRPIVATDVPGCRQVIDDEVNGVLVPPRDARSLADALQFLLDSPERRDAMGRAGRAKAEAEFDEQAVIQHYLELYHAVLPSGFPIGPIGPISSVSPIDDTLRPAKEALDPLSAPATP